MSKVKQSLKPLTKKQQQKAMELGDIDDIPRIDPLDRNNPSESKQLDLDTIVEFIKLGLTPQEVAFFYGYKNVASTNATMKNRFGYTLEDIYLMNSSALKMESRKVIIDSMRDGDVESAKYVNKLVDMSLKEKQALVLKNKKIDQDKELAERSLSIREQENLAGVATIERIEERQTHMGQFMQRIEEQSSDTVITGETLPIKQSFDIEIEEETEEES